AQADVWGIGVVLFFMATCERPFETFDDGRYDQLVRRAVPVSSLRQAKEGDELLKMIDRCLEPMPDHRTSVQEIFEICQNYITQNKQRSEEHTSELQSRFDLVCRLLLEKKNKTNIKKKTQKY